MPKLKASRLKLQTHKGCRVQYLGRDMSMGIARKVYYCLTHDETFANPVKVRRLK